MKRVNFKNSVIALAISLVVVSCGGGNSNKQQENIEIAAVEQQEIKARKIETQEVVTQIEPAKWISGDFKLIYDEQPMVVMEAMAGKGGELKGHQTLVRIKDKLYWHTVSGDDEAYLLFSMENGTLMLYEFNPHTKQAVRKKANFETIEGALRWNLTESIYASPKDRDKMTKTGTEIIAGINCEVYKNESSLDMEKLNKETQGLEALAKMLGGDTKQLEEQKKQMAGMDGTATWWIDPTKERFVARKHVHLKMFGRTTDMVTHNVLFFTDSHIDASEIPDMSEYTFLN